MTTTTDHNAAEQKHRQAIYINGVFLRWHYWGFIEEQVTPFRNLTFVAPEMNLSSIEEAYKNSYQYTGRKSNEKELYGGDVVEWVNNYGEENIGWIRYTKAIAGFYIVLIKGSYLPFYTGDVRNFAWGDLKVIGNIVENPELVEGVNANV